MMNESLNIRSCRDSDKVSIIELWYKCKLVIHANNPKLDIERKINHSPDLLLVGIRKDQLIATVMPGYEGHRGWINYLAVDPQYQHRDYGTQMMLAAEEKLKSMGCSKINLQVRETNLGVISFYQKMGYQIDAVTSLGKRLKKDPEYK